MSWSDEMVPIVRYLIDDIDSTSYNDGRIETTIVISAHLIQKEVDFSNTYSIDVTNETISPDPTDDVKDVGFINLVCLKTACIVVSSEYKTYTLSAVKVTDGPSTIDMTKVGDKIKERYDGVCKAYQDAKLRHQMGDMNFGQIITTPRTVESIPAGW